MKKVLFICPYPAGMAPSQRFRYEQYIGYLHEKGFQTKIEPFFSKKAYSAVYQSGNLFAKIHAIAVSYFSRLAVLLHLRRFDFIFIHREASPLGPPVIEFIIAKVLRKKIIYDFDDAIWLTDNITESALTRFLRCRSKVRLICRWSYRISAGNEYLAAYARRFNKAVVVNPTTIETSRHSPHPDHDFEKEGLTIGWTGSRTTLKYLRTILPAFQILEVRYPDLKFIIIADEDPKLGLKNSIFIPWNEETEIADLSRIDIGLMPLTDDPWTRGKCGFKALQYMAMSIPALVSPVGVNREIVRHGVDGYWCDSTEDWVINIETLRLDPQKRKTMGERGRQSVVLHFSTESNSARFLSLFQ